jgi:hypothetical protein
MVRVLALLRGVPRALRVARERSRRQKVIDARKTDVARWRNRASYNPSWASRLDSAMPLLAGAAWVADLGCGMQALRARLGSDATYLPMDLKPWTGDTLICDLNARDLPDHYIALCDVCVVMGVLEYLYDPDWLLARLAEHAETIVLSYTAVDMVIADRAGNGWVNAFTSDEVVRMVERAGYGVVGLGRHDDQLLVKASRSDFDAVRRAHRDARRLAFRSMIGPAAVPAVDAPAVVPVAPPAVAVDATLGAGPV